MLGCALAVGVVSLSDSSPQVELDSLVVVPLVDVSDGGEQEYLAQGLSEALTQRLSALRGLRLVSHRRALKLTGRESLEQLTSDLEVDAVLRGTVENVGPWVKIHVELVEGATGRVLLTSEFNRDLEDALELEAEVASAVAQVVSERLMSGARRGRRIDPDAYKAYLRGRYYRHRGGPEDLERAVSYLERSIDLDESFAEAHAALAEVWLMRAGEPGTVLRTAWERSSASAAEALRLDPELPAAHAADAMIKFFLEWDFAAAGSSFENVLARSPNEAGSIELYARYLTVSGRFEEALEHYATLDRMEPDGQARISAVQVLLFSHRFDEARDLLQDLMAERPECPDVRLMLGLLYEQLGRESESVASYIAAMERYEMPEWEIEALAELGVDGGFRELFSVLAEQSRSPVQRAAWLARLGESQEVVALLEEALLSRDKTLPWIAVHPAFEGLREDPGYQRILDILGLQRPPVGGDAPPAENPMIFSFR